MPKKTNSLLDLLPASERALLDQPKFQKSWNLNPPKKAIEFGDIVVKESKSNNSGFIAKLFTPTDKS